MCVGDVPHQTATRRPLIESTIYHCFAIRQVYFYILLPTTKQKWSCMGLDGECWLQSGSEQCPLCTAFSSPLCPTVWVSGLHPRSKALMKELGWSFSPPSFFACSKNSIIAFARRTKLLCISQCKMIASKYLSTLQMLNLLRRPKEMKYLKVTLLERGLFFFFNV